MKPLLYRLQVVIRRNTDPPVAGVAENAFGIELAYIWVLREQRVAFFKCVDVLVVAEAGNINI